MVKELKKIVFVVSLPVFIPIGIIINLIIIVVSAIPIIFKSLGEIIKEELNS